MKLALTEKQVTEQVKQFLEINGWTYLRLQSGLLRTADKRFLRVGKAGLPDAVAFHGCYEPGYTKTLFLEFKKSSGGKLSPEQEAWRLAAIKKRLMFMVVSDFKEFKQQYEDLYFPAGYDATGPIGDL